MLIELVQKGVLDIQAAADHAGMTREEFLQVSGVGERKLVQYGETFLKEIRKHLQNAEEEND